MINVGSTSFSCLHLNQIVKPYVQGRTNFLLNDVYLEGNGCYFIGFQDKQSFIASAYVVSLLQIVLFDISPTVD